MDNLILYALIKKYINDQLSKIDPSIPSEYITEDELAAELAKLSFPIGTYLFKTSSISSTFAGPSGALEATDLVDPALGPKIKVGDLAIFPDDKSNVLYLGTISEIDEYPSLVVSNITYLKDNWIFTGDWHQGMISSYPEVYRFEGGLWLCLGSSITNPPHEESEQEVKEWKLLAASGNGDENIPNITFTSEDLVDPNNFNLYQTFGLDLSEAGKTKFTTLQKADGTYPEKIYVIFDLSGGIGLPLYSTTAPILFHKFSTFVPIFADQFENYYISDNMFNQTMEYFVTDSVNANDRNAFCPLYLMMISPDSVGAGVFIHEDARPTFYKINGDIMTDTGSDTYLVSTFNLTPKNVPIRVGDIVIFYTDTSFYISTVTEINSSISVLVTVNKRLGYILPDITDADEGKVLKIQDGKLIWATENA